MNRACVFILIFVGGLLVFSPYNIKAQVSEQETDDGQIERPNRPNLLRELDLTPDQIQQIRRFNRERRAATQESKSRLQAANQALDEAIYSNAGETEIQARQKEMQAAHADFVKNRTINEQFVKQVLTQEQFDKFRNLQSQYKQQKRNPNNPDRNRGNGLNANQNKKSAEQPPDKSQSEKTQNDKTLNQRQQNKLKRQERRQMRRRQP
ncbi:MAG: Spy/CpxP family protein refolding chaperone [Pyrinomonadaceae bacterium]